MPSRKPMIFQSIFLCLNNIIILWRDEYSRDILFWWLFQGILGGFYFDINFKIWGFGGIWIIVGENLYFVFPLEDSPPLWCSSWRSCDLILLFLLLPFVVNELWIRLWVSSALPLASCCCLYLHYNLLLWYSLDYLEP